MRFPANRPLRFALQFVPLFILCLWLYSKALPLYQPAVLSVANAVTSRLSPPTRIEINPAGGWNSYVTEAPGEERHLLGWTGFVSHLIYLGLLFLPPLLLATPAPISQRFRLLALGLALLYVAHVLSIVGLVRGTYCLRVAPGNFSCLWLLRVVYVSGQISGAVLWAALTWRYWVPEGWLRGGEQAPPTAEA